MRSYLVVVPTPSLAFSHRVIQAHEPVGVKAFLAVEALDERVVGGLARPREVERHALHVGPQIELAGDKIRCHCQP